MLESATTTTRTAHPASLLTSPYKSQEKNNQFVLEIFKQLGQIDLKKEGEDIWTLRKVTFENEKFNLKDIIKKTISIFSDDKYVNNSLYYSNLKLLLGQLSRFCDELSKTKLTADKTFTKWRGELQSLQDIVANPNTDYDEEDEGFEEEKISSTSLYEVTKQLESLTHSVACIGELFPNNPQARKLNQSLEDLSKRFANLNLNLERLQRAEQEQKKQFGNT